MFTGLIETTGQVVACSAAGALRRLRIAPARPDYCADVEVGESIAVSGVCLTVVALDPHSIEFDVAPETLARTTLASLAPRAQVNLERSLTAGSRLGGHFVAGHVDALSIVLAITDEGSASRWRFALPAAVEALVATKGSVALDGVSLTVAAVSDGAFEVQLIPHTLAVTTFGQMAVGTEVNLEADLLARYVQRALAVRTPHAAVG